MKKLICLILITLSLFMFSGCVNHNDGVCDYEGCDRTLTVVRYDKNHELCLEHAIEEGFR